MQIVSVGSDADGYLLRNKIFRIRKVSEMVKMQKATAVCEIFGDGQKVTAAVIEMSAAVKKEEVTAENFEIAGRKIVGASVGDSGNRVVLDLDPGDEESKTRYMIGRGRDARTGIRRPVLEIRYLPTGESITSTEVSDELADKFRLFRYQVPESGQYLDYQLYVPEKPESGKKYPLVLFMHDMGACSDDVIAPLAQGTGAVTWVKKENQEKRPCFVLAPCYPRKTANDEYQVTWEADATAALVKALCAEYEAIDSARVYGTGQSMGCMMLCELNLRYAEIFAGSFLVAGQWDPERMGAVKDQNLWILVSEKDEKAFPVMGACMESVEQNGGSVVRGHVDAKAPLEEQNRKMRQIAEEGGHIFFTWYEGDSVLPENAEVFPGAFHVNTWVHAYELDAVQEWLFTCRK